MTMIYSLDTSALIDGIERFYPIRNFPQFWARMDELISEGRLQVSEEAWAEAVSVDAPVKKWCEEKGEERHQAIYYTSPEVTAIVGAIVSNYPQWVIQGGKNGADPFVIAVAEIESGMVISGEINGGPSKPKIPYVCGQRGTPHGRLVDLIRNEDWVIG
ncbi:MAG: DUF4411 family protein [Cryobacterium sp.]|nr:DUF4411 family protein [Cryobacterium sp.]